MTPYMHKTQTDDLETHKILTASTKHLTEAEDDALEGATDSGGVMSGSYGFLVWVGSDAAHFYTLDQPSDGLKAVLQLARDNGCDYVLFDSDGPVIEGVPEYDR